MTRKIDYEDILFAQMKLNGIPLPLRQYKATQAKSWKTDFCWLKEKLICEVDGGVGVRWHYNPITKERKAFTGSHTTMLGYEKNRLQDAAAFKEGYTVLRVTPSMIGKGNSSVACDLVKQYLEKLKENKKIDTL